MAPSKDKQHKAVDDRLGALTDVLAGINRSVADKVAPQLRHIGAVAHAFIDEHVDAEDNPNIVGSAAWKAAIADCEATCTCARHEPGALD